MHCAFMCIEFVSIIHLFYQNFLECSAVSCGAPEIPEFLTIGPATDNDFTFGKTITYMCSDRSLAPYPYSTITCESTKLWSAPPPSKCVVRGNNNSEIFSIIRSIIIVIIIIIIVFVVITTYAIFKLKILLL